MTRKKKSSGKFLKTMGKALLFIVKIPYFFGKLIYKVTKKTSEVKEKRIIKRKRKAIKSKYKSFKTLKEINGTYEKWFQKTSQAESKIGLIIGARGSGKTAFGIKLLENIYAKTQKECFAMGFKEDELPIWIHSVKDTSEIKNDSIVLIDEGGILFSSRSSMSSANKLLSGLMLIARHKNISILFISQNSSNLEVNILRQADFLALKPSSLLQKEFERKIIQKIYKETQKEFNKYKSDKGLTYIYSGDYQGFVSNPLPSFWKESISKSFKTK